MYCNIRDLKINFEMRGSGKPVLMLNSNGTDMRSMVYCIEPIFESREDWKKCGSPLRGHMQVQILKIYGKHFLRRVGLCGKLESNWRMA